MTLLASLLFATTPALAAGDAASGAVVYEKRCAQCHGAEGAADGSAAEFMLPRPRVFAENSSYKFRVTGSGELPTEQDIYDIITEGIPGTSMPGFDVISDTDRWNLVAYVRSLSEDFVDPDYLSTATAMPELQEMNPAEATADSVERGSELYQENQCFKCHGQQGRGDGPSWNKLTDDWDDPIVPANLSNKESYRNGASPEDVYRTISTGLNGTPMPSYADSISVEDRWALVNYVLSMGPPLPESPAEAIQAERVAAVPQTADDPAWDTAPPARFSTLPNIIEPPRLFWSSVEFVTAQALYSDSEIALRIQWDDRNQSTGSNLQGDYADRDTTIYLDTDHPDQFAVQFPAKLEDSVRPYFLFGDKKKAVNLWWWRADTNTTVERNGKSIEKLTDQKQEGQQIQADVTFADGRYTMLVRRSLTTEDGKLDIQFEAGRFHPVAFHVWDGSRGEVGQRRSMTTWYWLFLRPEVKTSALIGPAAIAYVITLLLLGLVVRHTRRPVREEVGSEESGNRCLRACSSSSPPSP